MSGPAGLHVVGTLRELEIFSRHGSVEPDLPVLWTSGRHDEESTIQVAAIGERIPQAEWVIFEQSGHLSHTEEPDRYLAVLGDFLARAEAAEGDRGTAGPRRGSSRERSAGAGRLTGRPGPS